MNGLDQSRARNRAGLGLGQATRVEVRKAFALGTKFKQAPKGAVIKVNNILL